jgi:pimeloyl-ACP methyl ester carboxylesterase
MTKRLIILPGMGATAEMYDQVRSHVQPGIDFVDWPAYRGETSYPKIAQRVIDENGITEQDIVGGSSFGGMVALEAAQLTKAKTVILIGSAMHSGEILPLFPFFSPFIAPQNLFPEAFLITSMFAQSDPLFTAAMCSYLPAWKGYRRPAARVRRIHGKKDHVIPCPTAGCEVIDDAGHLLAITHPRETAAFLEKVRAETE